MSFPTTFPIFPLSSVLLLPGAFLPLHIFEPRYRAMVADCLEGEKMLGMALPLPGGADDFDPPVHPVCGLGRIVQVKRYPDGRADIVLAGLARMRIERELTNDKPYRTVVATPLPEELPDGEDLAPDAMALLEFLPPLEAAEHAELLALPVARLIDLLVLRLPMPVLERHRIHAIPDVKRRLTEATSALHRLQGRHGREAFDEDDPRLN